MTALPPLVSVIVKPGPSVPASGVAAVEPAMDGSCEREARGEGGGGGEKGRALHESPTVDFSGNPGDRAGRRLPLPTGEPLRLVSRGAN